jgi:murein L,D-transpeptidase YcbB/YkuD
MNVVFDGEMTTAVNIYKKSVGFAPNGILDMSTQAMLNTYSMKTAVLNDNCVRAALADID